MATITGYTQYVFLYIFFWFISTILLRFIFRKSTNFCLPPSPPALPIIGYIHYLSLNVYKCFHNLSKHGPILYLHLPSYPLVLVSSAQMATEIFKTHDVEFARRPDSGFQDWMVFGNAGFISAPYGDYWRFLKKLSMTELLGSRQVERSRNVRREELMQLLHKLMEAAQENKVVDLGAELMKLTNNNLCRMALSTRCSGEDNEAEKCRKLVDEYHVLAGKMSLVNLLGPLKRLGFWVLHKQASNVQRQLDQLFEKLWKEHEERAKRDGSERKDKDLMDILLEVYQDENAEITLSRTHVKAFILDIFVAGTGSSASKMQWVMAELINHPNIFKKLREEINLVVGGNRLVEEADIPSLPYLQAVVKETLRLYPPPITARQCRETCKIGGFDIPEGTVTMINMYTIMRDPKIWENPEEFYPERFLISGKEEYNQKQNFGYTPFGGGRRICPGMNLANCLMHITVATMVQCFDWEVDGHTGDGAGKINMQSKAGFSIAMAHPLLCLPSVRFNPFEV